MTTPPLVRARDLRCTYPGRQGGAPVHAVAGVDLDLLPGSSTGLVGESGSGKTTVARVIVGLEAGWTGTLEVDGRPWTTPRGPRARRAHARTVQMVFQDPYGSLDPRQSIGSMLQEVLVVHRLHRDRSAARVTELLEQVGLDREVAHARPRALSGGQRQRAAIARALAAEPRLVVLDEAVAALDVSIQAQILNLLADLREQTGVAYLVITHDLAVVRQVTEQCLVMHHGELVEQGPTSRVLAEPEHEYTRLLRDSVPGPHWRGTHDLAPEPTAVTV